MKVTNYLLVIASGLVLGCSSPDFPEKLDLTDPWHFHYDSTEIGIENRWFDGGIDFQNWPTVPAGNYWSDTFDGRGWYIQTVWLPENQTDRKLALVISSVDDNAKVWMNDSLIIDHQGANQRLYGDITHVFRPEQKNRITIMVDDLGGPGGLNGRVYIKKYLDEVDLIKGKFYDSESIESPEWVKNAVIYEVFVRQFSRSGDFKGVQRRLDELRDLGVTTLWLMPIHPVGEVHRKGTLGSPYSVRDYYAVNPAFGTKEDFKALVDAVHERGMYLILDMVLNHSAWDNPLIEKHPEWYTQNDAGEIISPNEDWSDVADFNYDNPELRQYMIDMLKYWVREFDVDGFRFDVAGMVPLDFWIDARPEVEKVNPDVFFLAEDSDPEMHVSAFDMTYSWNIYWGLINMLRDNEDAGYIESIYQRERYKYPQDALRMRFTENHDEQRAAKLLTKPQALVASVYVNTIPGVPLIYNGQEIGATDKPDIFEKDVVDWPAGKDMYRNHYARLFEIRKNHPAITGGKFRLLECHPDSAVMSYLRKTNEETLLIVLNFKDAGLSFSINLNEEYRDFSPVYTHRIEVMEEQGIHGKIEPYGWGIFALE